MTDITRQKIPFTEGIIFKMLMLFCVILVLLISTLFLNGIINERQIMQNEAYSRTIGEWGGQQALIGPAMVFEWERKYIQDKTTKIETGKIFQIPETIQANVFLETSTRKRGIYDIPLYTSHIDLKGEFKIGQLASQIPKNAQILWSKTKLIFALRNNNGIVETPTLLIDDKNQKVESLENSLGSQIGFSNIDQSGKLLSYAIKIVVHGGSSFSIMPIAKENKFSIKSNWKYPEFGGNFLPLTHDISDNGFEANWSIPEISRNFPSNGDYYVLNNLLDKIQIAPIRLKDHDQEYQATNLEDVSIGIFDPVNSYKLSERSLKYAVLFIIVPFIAFLLFELKSGIRAHIFQYSLIGVAVVIFYLLLLAISERLEFGIAFFITSFVTSVLCGYYGKFMFGNFKRGFITGLGMFAMYIMLYFIVKSEDDALLIGSLFIFAILIITMFTTRKINWTNLKTKGI